MNHVIPWTDVYSHGWFVLSSHPFKENNRSVYFTELNKSTYYQNVYATVIDYGIIPTKDFCSYFDI